MNTLSRRAFLGAVSAGAALTLAGCVRPSSGEELTMACGEPGGLYIEFGGRLSEALETSTGTRLAALATNGSSDNIELLRRGAADLAIALIDTAEPAVNAAAADGTRLVAIGRVYQNYLQCIVREDGDIRTLADLAGREVSTGASGSGSSHTTARVFVSAGLAGPRTPVASQLQLAQAVDALERGDIDAFFWSGGVPTPQIAELSTRLPLRILDLSPAMRDLTAEYPHQYLSTRIPTGVYGAEQAVPTVGIANVLLARADFAPDRARDLVDTLLNGAAELVPPGSAGLQFLTAAHLIDTGAVPLHPAAAARYRERYG